MSLHNDDDVLRGMTASQEPEVVVQQILDSTAPSIAARALREAAEDWPHAELLFFADWLRERAADLLRVASAHGNQED